MILNLKQFNEHVAYHHFKMDTLASAISMMKPHCFMDFKDAYYSVPIASIDQQYLKFIWDEQLYKFVCFPNGLACCPRMFTKLLKPVYANLRLLHTMNVRFSLLDIAQRILGVTLPNFQ